jgi:hypothetical protein
MSNRRNKWIGSDLSDEEPSRKFIRQTMRHDSDESDASNSSRSNSKCKTKKTYRTKIRLQRGRISRAQQVSQMHRESVRDILCKKIEEKKVGISNLKLKLKSFSVEHIVFQYENAFARLYKSYDAYQRRIATFTLNLIDKDNRDLFVRVLNLEISPEHLAKMSAHELAGEAKKCHRHHEEHKNACQMEKEAMEDLRLRPKKILKKTHKGEFEVNVNENFILFPEEKDKKMTTSMMSRKSNQKRLN